MTDTSLTVVVPVFNEAQSLPSFLPELVGYCRDSGFQLIFVDDASTDESASLIQPECNDTMCRLIQHKVNRGYGGALKTGIRNVRTEFVVTMDADGQHRPDDARRLWESGHLCDADMVVGRPEWKRRFLPRVREAVDPRHCGPAGFVAGKRSQLRHEALSNPTGPTLFGALSRQYGFQRHNHAGICSSQQSRDRN